MTFSSPTIERADRGARRARRRAVAAALVLPLLAAAAAWGAKTWPEPRGTLSDFAGVVDPASADSIEALGAELRAKTGAQLAVVTERELGGEPIENEAVGIFQQWGIGRKQKDDGVLVLLAVAERRVRIEVGYGLEGILPDGKCGFIIRHVMGPDLAADRFGPGLWRGADAIAGVIARDRGATLSPGRGAALPEETDSRDHSLLPLLILFVIFTVFSWLMRGLTGRGGRTRSRRGWMGPFWGGFGGFGGYGGGFGGGGGGLGGGFGGFGGGRSGGGGASGGF